MLSQSVLLSLALAARIVFAGGGEWVSPDTKSEPEKVVKSAPGTKSVPDCVSKVLNAIFDREKAFFPAKKVYTESLADMHALSAVGVGCAGWDLPLITLTYGGSGYTAMMYEAASGTKWVINQDKNLVLDARKVVGTLPTAKK